MSRLPVDKWLRTMRNSPDDVLVRMFGGSDFPQEAVWAAGAELERREQVKVEAGAYTNLYEWRKQVAAGQRDAFTFDGLWRKACEEATEFELRAIMSRIPYHQSHPGWSSLDNDLPF